jgi:hypothetical protein
MNFTIDHRRDKEIVLCEDEDSLAAPYIKEYKPTCLKDFQELGIIPKAIKLEHLHAAREAIMETEAHLKARLIPWQSTQGYADSDHYAEAYHTAQVRESMVEGMKVFLNTRYLYSLKEADLLARKIASLETTVAGKNFQPVWRRIELADDLLIHSPVLIKSSINSIVARNIIIFKYGVLKVEGSYLQITCHSLSGRVVDLKDSTTEFQHFIK